MTSIFEEQMKKRKRRDIYQNEIFYLNKASATPRNIPHTLHLNSKRKGNPLSSSQSGFSIRKFFIVPKDCLQESQYHNESSDTLNEHRNDRNHSKYDFENSEPLIEDVHFTPGFMSNYDKISYSKANLSNQAHYIDSSKYLRKNKLIHSYLNFRVSNLA